MMIKLQALLPGPDQEGRRPGRLHPRHQELRPRRLRRLQLHRQEQLRRTLPTDRSSQERLVSIDNILVCGNTKLFHL